MPPKKKQKSAVLDAMLKDVPEAWAEALRPALEEAEIESFLGGCRSVLPPPEMLLQALKPASPADVKTVVFGLAPYPRAESACGIALFDAALTSWEDSKFGKVVSMRNMVKVCTCHLHFPHFLFSSHFVMLGGSVLSARTVSERRHCRVSQDVARQKDCGSKEPLCLVAEPRSAFAQCGAHN
jgi:hypothetical protein